MGTDEKMEKKIEEFNEFMLKQAAITFSLEGVSKDLKNFLQKKIVHNRTNITQLTSMVTAVAHSPSKELREGSLTKGSIMYGLLDHIVREIRFTDMALNVVIQNIMNKEAMLSSEKDPSTEREKGV
jgi:fatty acid/phospholipid biosynthesis enzyme